MLEKRDFDRSELLARLSQAVAVVSGFFSLLVFSLMLVNYLQIESADPVDHLLITQMRQTYAVTPAKDEVLAERIRILELANRKAFFTSQEHLRIGGWMLLTGVCVFMVAFKNAIRWRRAKPTLDAAPTADAEFLARAESRQWIMWTGVAMLGVGLAVALLTESALKKEAVLMASPAAPGELDAAKAAAEAFAAAPAEGAAAPGAAAMTVTWEALEKQWPSFRGPGANGRAHFTNAPKDWDVAAGRNIRWKTALALPGFNSPVVWDKKVFLSGATETERAVYCYNADDGALLWSQTLPAFPGAPAAPPKVNEETGFAAPSLASNGALVFAVFANGDLAAYDFEGKLAWGYNLGLPKNHYGHSSSLLAYDRFLYVQLDQKDDPKVIALDAATGKEAWHTARPTISWASPILAQTTAGPQLILNSSETVDAYDPSSGAPLWSQACLSGEVAPSPSYANGVVFAANEYAMATGIGIEKSGETVTSKILWEFDELLPEVSSPVGDGERFYFGTSAGTMVCLDAKSGEKHWEQEFDHGFYSSPVLVGDTLYIADKEGGMHLMKAAAAYEKVAALALGESAFATPAFLDGRIYVRTAGHLLCIEQGHG